MTFSDVELPSNRKFGFFFTLVFFASGTYFFYVDSTNESGILFLIALSLLAITLIKPEVLLPLNKLWMRLGLLIGMVVSPIVLGVIFFLLFTPIALVMRLLGRDELRLKMVSRDTFWRDKEGFSDKHTSFKNQF